MLVTEHNARAWNAFSRGLCTLTAHRLLLITFQLSLPAGETIPIVRQEYKQGLKVLLTIRYDYASRVEVV